VYTHSSVENEKKKDWAASGIERERERERERKTEQKERDRE